MARNISPPPPPQGKDGIPEVLANWLLVLRNYVTAATNALSWTLIDKAGSRLSDIVTRPHSDLTSIQGGTTGEAYHLTAAQTTALTGSGDNTIHYHSSDRDRANHTGTQLLSTISDAGTAASGDLGVDVQEYSATRQKVTSNVTIYVRTDGNDSNTGSANTSGGAFLTIQKAWDVLSALDLSIYTGTINVADGTYTAGLLVNKIPLGGSGTYLTGNTTTPANVIISVSGTAINVTAPVTLSIDGIKLQTSGSGQTLITVNHPGAVISIGRNEYGSCSNGHHLSVVAGYLTRIAGGFTYTISSTTSQTHINAATNAAKINMAAQTVSMSGTPAFTTAYVNAVELASVNLLNNTYSGSATGKRYNVTLNAVVNTYGATLPGDAAGTTATGGQYA